MTLDELRALCEAVTPGEWHAWEIYNPTWPPSVPKWSFGNNEVSPDDLSEADARFIAAARTYMPALLLRINELEAQEKELTAARLEIERLRGALEQIEREATTAYQYSGVIAADWVQQAARAALAPAKE